MTLWPHSIRGANEADLSTKQQATQANPRVPRTDEHARRPQNPQAAPGQGTKATHRSDPAETAVLTQPVAVSPGSQRFPRRYRLRKRPEFLALQRRGRRRTTVHFVVITRQRSGPPSRLGVTTSKRVGCAPQRNRVRRLVREFFRRHHMTLGSPCDVLVIARPGAADLRYADVHRELSDTLIERE